MDGDRLRATPPTAVPPAAGPPAGAAAVGLPVLADYRCLERLGSGAMGVVYRAHQRSMDRIVAVKILKPEVAHQPGFVERFRREAQISGKWEHPNIIRGIAVGEENGLHYFVMEFVDGESVKEVQARLGALPVGDAVRIVLDVARALQQAEGKRIVHRDIKPANIMITREGVVKLADLGLAKAVDEEAGLTQSGVAFGTPEFMAPEQIADAARADARSDIYALGATLFRLLTNRSSIPGSNVVEILHRKLHGAPERLRAVDPRLPPALEQLVDRMMATAPAARFQSATELVRHLEATGLASRTLSWLGGDDGTPAWAVTATTPLPLGPSRRRHWAAVAVLTVVLVVAAALAWTLWPQGTDPAGSDRVAPPLPAPANPMVVREAGKALRRAIGELSSGRVDTARAVLRKAAQRYPGAGLERPLAEIERGTLVLFQFDTAEATGPPMPAWEAAGVALRSGDQYRFAIVPSRSCHVYVFQRDAQPSITQLFPNPSYSSAGNPIAAGQVHWLPGEAAATDRWLALEGPVGTERVVVVAVTSPLRPAGAVRLLREAPPDALAASLRAELPRLVGDPDAAAGCFADGAVQEITFQHD